MGRAFYDTDQWSAVVPDPSMRERKLGQVFDGAVKLTFAAGGIVERTAGFEGVAAWIPPGRDIGLWPVIKSGFASARFMVTPPFPSFRRVMAMLRQFEETHKQQMPDPHWYLMAIGVDPVHHRSGFGSALVRCGTQRADDDGLPIYLETETGTNVAFYESLGFEVLGEIVIEAYSLPFSLLIYRPKVGLP